eukprot:3935248-Rhodomonas_salina.2
MESPPRTVPQYWTNRYTSTPPATPGSVLSIPTAHPGTLYRLPAPLVTVESNLHRVPGYPGTRYWKLDPQTN